MAMLQSLSPTEQLPHTFDDVMKQVSLMPTVVGWMRRAACRRGASIALALGKAHYQENFDLAKKNKYIQHYTYPYYINPFHFSKF